MDYISGPVILYSQDKIRMMDFLSDVFEFDVDSEQDLVTSGELQLKLVELPELEKANFQSVGIKFAFKTKDRDQIKEIVNKCNFFIYRKSDTHQHLDHNETITNGEDTNVTIKDIDGRLWQFDVEIRQWTI